MAAIALTVSYTNGDTKNATIKARDIIAFEREFGTGFAKAVKEERLEHMYWLAWFSLNRTGEDARIFDEFLDAVDEVDIAEVPLAPPSSK